MKRPLLAVLLAVSLVTPAFPQTPNNRIKIEEAVENRDHSQAVKELLELKAADPAAFIAADYDYLLARMAEEEGRFAIAMSNYQQAAERGSLFTPYALARMSRIARSTGNPMLERLLLIELICDHKDSLLAGPAASRLARNNFETGNFSETIRILSGGNSKRKTGSSDVSQLNDAAGRDDMQLLGEAYLRSGDQKTARDIFTSLINTSKDPAKPDNVAARSCLSLDLIDRGTSTVETRAPDIPGSEHLRRAEIYQFNRDFQRARLHYEALVNAEPASPEAAAALFQIGRGYVQQSDFATAVSYFERVLEQYPGQPAARDALLQSASCYARIGKPEESVKRYQRFIDLYPSDEKADRAYLNIVDVLRDQGAEDEALKWCVATENAFNGKVPANLAIFDEARIFIAGQKWQQALDKLERLTKVNNLGGATVPGGTTPAEVAFLRGYCYENSGNYNAAIETYLSIEEGRDSYYGWRATECLRRLATLDESKTNISQKLEATINELNTKDADARSKAAGSILRLTTDDTIRPRALGVLQNSLNDLPGPQLPEVSNETGSSDFQRAGSVHGLLSKKLSELGLYDEAAPEMETAMGPGVNGSAAYELAAAYARGDRADRALLYVDPMWRNVPAAYPIELMPREQLELLYPAPYRGIICKHASARGLDPRFLLAVMRQESAFRPDAESNVGARGLMQFISLTSERIARELKLSGFEQDELYDPHTSILLGSQYLADLFLFFPDKPEAVAAAYNAGEDNMARWLARSRSEMPEQYVPEIAYAQSKDYVYRVMANYRMYRLLYDANLKPNEGPLVP